MIAVLDRHLGWTFLRNAVMVALATIIVFVVLDVLMSITVLARAAPSPWTKVELFACRIPALLGLAFPLAATVAVLATVAPMLRRGEFTALGAAGVNLHRATRSLLFGAAIAGCADLAVADLVAPGSTARAMALQDLLEGQQREGRVWRTEDGAHWFAGRARLVHTPQPELGQIAVATADDLVIAPLLRWQDGAWIAPKGSVRLDARQGAQRLGRLPPGPLPAIADLPYSPDELYRRLLPRYTMTSSELFARGERADLAVAWGRLGRLLMIPLMAMAAMAVFVRFVHRDRIAVGAIYGGLAALVPAGVIALAGATADTVPGHPALVALGGSLIAAAPPLWWWWRWRL